MGVQPQRSAAIFVLPTTTSGQTGPVAGWISTCGWASAAQRELGRAWIVTPQGVLDIEEVRRRAADAPAALPAGRRRARQALPPIAKTVLKDGREALRARRFRPGERGPWTEEERTIEFVWQRHELFHSGGLHLADRLQVPSVLFVPALLVWQAEQWNVRRPGWGNWLERRGEQPALRHATLVACGSEVVAEEVARLGVTEDRLIITPTGVDLDLFAPPIDRAAARRAAGVGDEIVIGWAGSFRPFHAIDDLVRAVAPLTGVSLLLVGDGPERTRIEELAQELGVHVRFTGLVPHHELPLLLAAMDIGVVLGRPDEPFHYSPLKLAEYLAAGLAVVAPNVRQLTNRLDNGRHAVFFVPGDTADLSRALQTLADDPEQRRRIAAGGHRVATHWSWDQQVRAVRRALALR